MAEDFSKNIKQAKLYADALEAINKKIEGQNKTVGFLAQELGIAYGGFITQIEKSNERRREELKLANQASASLREQQKNAGKIAIEALGLKDILKQQASQQDIINKHLTSQFKDIKDIHEINDKISELAKQAQDGDEKAIENLEELKKIRQDIYKEQELNNKDVEKAILEELKSNQLLQETLKAKGVDLSNNHDIMRSLNGLFEDGTDILKAMASLTEKDLGKNYSEYVDKIVEANSQSNMLIDSEREVGRAIEEANNKYREQIGLWEKIQGFAEKNGATIRKDIWSSMKDYDQVISDAGRDFGFVQDMTIGTAVQMAALNSEAARFGMSSKETLQMMGDLGDELKTIDKKYLAESVNHFLAIQKATGISSEELMTIAGEMMRAGKSAEQVEGFMDESNKIAKKFGVNTKNVLQGVSKNIDKMRQMGFQGGEESLTRMAARAERLNMDMNEMFDVAKKARNIEGAMEMAADLQLAGGSFANINPMDLLAAARKGPEELQKILTQMGGDIGDFDKKTGKLTFDAIDADRLQMVADATNQTVDSIQNGLQKAAADNAKLDVLGLSSSVGEDTKNFLADMTDMKDGELSVSPELLDLASSAGIQISNVDDLKNLSQEDMAALMEEKKMKEESLEEQALANQSFTESMTALKDSFMGLFTVFEPLIKKITELVQWINSMGPLAKGLTAALVGLVMFSPKLVSGFQSFRDSAISITKGFKGFLSGFKEGGIKGAIKGAFGKKDDIAENANAAGSTQVPGKSGGGLQSLAEGLKAMGDPKVFAGIGALALAAPVLVLFIPAAILALPALALAGMMHDQIIQGFEALALGLSAMGEKGILNGIAALALAVVPLILFIPAALLVLPAMAVAGRLDKLIVRGFSALSDGLGYLGSNLTNIIKGSLALAVAGASLIPFAISAQLMSDVNWLGVLAGIGILSLFVLGLIGLGALLMTPEGLFLAVGVLALVAVGAGLMVFGDYIAVFAAASQMIQGMNFDWLGNLGWNLLIASPGLLLGGLALMVAAPALMFGSMGLLALGVAAQALSGIDWNAFAAIGDALSSIVPGLLGFSLAGLMFVNPVTLLGMLLMIGNLGMLAAIMAPLALSLNTGADGLDRFADGLTKLQAAANSLDFERLEALKELSVGMATGSGGGGMGAEIQKIAEALAALTKTAGGGSGGGNKKIEISLKLNGRDLQNIIVDDTSIVS